jgi:hypothetical protein
MISAGSEKPCGSVPLKKNWTSLVVIEYLDVLILLMGNVDGESRGSDVSERVRE